MPACRSATISSAYSLVSKDFEKLRAAITLLDPGAIYVSDAAPFGFALAAIKANHRAVVVAGKNAEKGCGISSAEVLATPDSEAVTRAFAAVTPETIAKFLFTSGSTGAPKAVINTHGMLTSNQAAKAQVWPFLERSELVVLDWLPWSHTFGANHNFNMVLRNGGTLYIDQGKPAPGLFSASLDNLRSVMPTVYFNVPRGFDMLLGALREDEALRRKFFEERPLRVLRRGGAAAERVGRAGGAVDQDHRPRHSDGLGLGLDRDRAACDRLPFPCRPARQHRRAGAGHRAEAGAVGEKLEVRVRGPNVTPGYWKAPDLTAKAFDEEGFYRIGDAVKFADPARPERGLFFDGRISEDFKLSSGTWVTVGMLRVAAVAALAPLAQDIVIAGHDEDEVRFLVFPNVVACRALSGLPETAALADVLAHAKVREAVAQGMAKLKAQNGGSAGHATRALILAEPPSIDGGEITDKGYINQSAVLSRRADALAKLRDDASTEWIACGRLA